MNSSSHANARVKILFKNEPTKMPAWKRAIDVACCLVALPFLCLVAIIMAVVLRLFSPGPIFFVQERIGYKGRRFMCYKFRTMVVGADTKSHQAYLASLQSTKSSEPMVKLDSKGDSRLIPGGWVLRATGLDELPQIINVLRKEMSVVGPRPCVPYEYERYQAWQRERFNAVPGLTGLWQVSGKNRTTFDEMVRLDIRYSRANSLLLDLRIILMTVPALLIQLADVRQARKTRSNPEKRMAILNDKASVKRSSQAAV